MPRAKREIESLPYDVQGTEEVKPPATAKRQRKAVKEIANAPDDVQGTEEVKPPAKAKRQPKAVKKIANAPDEVQGTEEVKPPAKAKRQPKAVKATDDASEQNGTSPKELKEPKAPKVLKDPKEPVSPSKASPAKKSTKKAPPEKEVLIRTETPKAGAPPGRRFLAMAWNVTTIRSLVNKSPTVLKNLMEKHQPDVICLQEHKLQEKDIPDMEKLVIELLPEYKCHWAWSMDKKGYSGVVVLTKDAIGAGGSDGEGKQKTLDSFFKARDTPKEEATQGSSVLSVTTGMGSDEHDREGRLITVEYDKFFIVFTYVPNSGDKLQRLSYRVDEWDQALLKHFKALESKKPVVWGGDFNVAHLDGDIWNAGAKHIPKSAGTTPQERNSFGELLASGFKDTFRHFHPTAENAFTYWSVRAGNRPWNRGLRLDYFVASESMFPEGSNKPDVYVHDAWIMHDAVESYGDHCPVAVVLNV